MLKINMNRIRLVIALCLTVLSFQMLTIPVLADETKAAENEYSVSFEEEPVDEIKGQTGAGKKLEEFIMGSGKESVGFIDVIAQFGYLLIVFGVGQMILAFKDDNADSKTRGTMVLLGGTFCAIIKPILISLGAL